MNFTETIDALAAKGYTKKLAGEMIKHFEEVVFEGLAAKGSVRFGNSGTFKVHRRKARVGNNPKTREPIQIPEKNVIKFKPSKQRDEEIN